MVKKGLEVNNRVKKVAGSGTIGTIMEIRVESTATSVEARENGIMYFIVWDNGSTSVCGEDMLEKVTE